jgi:hypothetical protein
MEGLRAHLDTTNSDRTPLSGETLRQFYRYGNEVPLYTSRCFFDHVVKVAGRIITTGAMYC